TCRDARFASCYRRDSQTHGPKFSADWRPPLLAKVIGVTFALPAESSEFLRRLDNKLCTGRDAIRIIRGTLDDCEVEVLHTGVGEKVCRQRVGEFLKNQQFEFLISAGFAGALDDQLHSGDLLLAR